ncbi:MAG: hypothetical protein HRT40_11090 [Campylobacteraceae bacterium]|nr:hypothetical protein [Campylobacteraceae bacterium]
MVYSDTFKIYKINNKFEKREQKILLVVLSLILLIFLSFDYSSENKLPDLFKKDYMKKNNIEILKLSTELLNNKNISSSKRFLYNFTYIINKDNKEFVCSANKVEINKIQDEFIITKYKEVCQEK